MISRKRMGFLSLLILCGAGSGWAREYIQITDPNFRPYPLAVPEFRDVGSGAQDLVRDGTAILRFDLEIIGVFKVLDPKSFIADPNREGITSASINFTDWINVGAEGLIKVGLQLSGTELQMDAHLFDVVSGKELLHKKYQGDKKTLRRMVHVFADEIVKHFTGNPSIYFTKIVFAKRSGDKTTKEICISDFDGYNEHCLIQNGSINLLPTWAADGSGFYYSSYFHGGPHLYLYDFGTRKSKVISAATGLNIGAAASLDGKKLALTLSKDENAEIYVMGADGSNPRRLTQNWAIDSSATWSPDGKRIAFVSERSGNPQIYVTNVDGSSEAKRLTFQGTYNQTPSWSPRGDWILFNARDERLVFDIFKINPDTGEIVRLTQDQGNNEHPSFSPDGNLVVFSSTRTGESKLYVMNADGSNQRLISRNKGEYTTPEWGPWIQAEKK